jgi:aspartokinase
MDNGLVKTLERNKDDEKRIYMFAKFGGSSVANAEQYLKLKR